MIYALLAIMLMVVIEIVIFNASSANYTRFKNEKDNQQAYLTVSSAAKVFCDSIANDSVTIDVVNEYKGENFTTTIKSAVYDNNNDVLPRNPEEVRNYIRSYVQECFEAEEKGTLPPQNKPKEYEIRATIDDKESKELDRVFVTVRMDKYDIIAEFTNKNEDTEKDDDIFYITARIPFINEDGNNEPIELPSKTVTDENDPNHRIVTTTHEVKWNKGNITIVRGKE